MKPLVAMLVLVPSLFLLPSPARAADPFAEYRIPDHWARTGQVSLSALNQSYLQQSGSQVKVRASNGDLAGFFDLYRDSEPLFAWLAVSADGRAAWRREQQKSVEDLARSDSHRSDAEERWTVDTGVRLYPWEPPLGLELSAFVTGDYGQHWNRQDRMASFLGGRDFRRDFERMDDYSTMLRAEVGIPFGRVRDATTVYDVHVIEERLIEAGAIEGPLPTGAREKLAALLAATQDLAYVHDRPARFLWREVERILREEGVLGDRGLDAYTALRLTEPTQPRWRFVRLRGAMIGPQVRAQTRHLIQRDEIQIDEFAFLDDGTLVAESHLRPGGARFTTSEDEYWAGVQGQFDRPLGWSWQLDASGFLGTPIRVGDHGVLSESSVSLAWNIADRWAASGQFAHSREYRRSRDEASSPWMRDFWTTQYVASLAYFLEDRTSASVSLLGYQARYAPNYYQRQWQVVLGVSYRFLGALAAPGQMAPAHPIH